MVFEEKVDESFTIKPAYGTNDETHSASKPKKTSYTLSIYIMILVNFLDNINFAIVIPSLYPYIADLDGSKTFYGWVVAAYSISQFICSPIFGFWSDRRPYREIEIIGNTMYAVAPNIVWILIARILVGISAANVGVTRGYISGATSPEERTKYMSLMMMAQVLGFIFGPGLGALLSKIPRWTLVRQEPRIVIDQYTIVGHLSSFLGFICVILLFLFLKELPLSAHGNKKDKKKKKQLEQQQKQKKQNTSSIDTANNIQHTTEDDHEEEIPKYFTDKLPRLIPIPACLFIYFVSVNTFTVFETIGTPLTFEFYGWTIWQNGLMYVGASIISIFGFIIVTIISKFVPDKVLLIFANILMTVGFGVLIDWRGVLWIVRYFIGAAIISFILPISQALTMSLFSKVIDERKQGILMGLMTSSSSLARIIAPIYATQIFENIGAYMLFLVVTVLCVVCVIFQIVVYPCLTIHPSQRPKKKKANAVAVTETNTLDKEETSILESFTPKNFDETPVSFGAAAQLLSNTPPRYQQEDQFSDDDVEHIQDF